MKRNLGDQLAWCKAMQWMLLAGTLAASTAIWFAGIRPARWRLAELDQRVAAGRAQLRENHGLSSELAAAGEQSEQLRQWLAQFDRRLPKQPDLAPFVRDLTKIGKEQSLSNLTWRPLEADHSVDGLAELPIRLGFEAQFPSVAEFLRRAEQMPRLAHVHDLELRTSPVADAAAGYVDVELTLDIFYGQP